MRITSNMLLAQQIAAMQSNNTAMSQAQIQVSTGKRINEASDDPAGAVNIMSSDSSLRALDEYRTNVQTASSRASVEDGVLQQMSDLLTRVKELGVQENTATATPTTHQVANSEINQIFQQLVDLGNTKFGNEYLFGGDQSLTAPFASTGSGATLSYTTTNPTGQRTVAIGDGRTIAATHDGTQLFLNTGVLDAVRSMSQSLDPASPSYGQTGISSALSSIDSALNNVQTMVGDTGARENTLQSAGQNIDALKANLTTFKSNVQDVDMESAMTELTSRQLAYQAALLATSKVESLNLTDYLQ